MLIALATSASPRNRRECRFHRVVILFEDRKELHDNRILYLRDDLPGGRDDLPGGLRLPHHH